MRWLAYKYPDAKRVFKLALLLASLLTNELCEFVDSAHFMWASQVLNSFN